MRARPPLCAGARICDGRKIDVLTAQGVLQKEKRMIHLGKDTM
jgi:hypothetical protein